MRATLLTLLVLACLAPSVSGQHKPAGTFQIGSCDARPAWSTFALLIDGQDFDAAADCARRTGLRWVLYLTADPYAPIGPPVAAVKVRADAAGLTPYLLALTDHEEWYEQTLAIPPRWPIGALDSSLPADQWVITETTHRVASQRTTEIKRVWPGLPVAWITSLVNDDRRHGPFFYRPLPTGIDIIALEGYVPAGATWAQTGGRYLSHALATRREPIALITQGFRWTGDPIWAVGPTEDGMAGLAEALRHPRVIASWLFTWQGLGPTLTGLSQMPEWRTRYEQAIGVP